MALVLAYSGMVALLLSRHDAWRDEAQLWLIGADSSSLAEVFRVSHQEVRPLTWFVLSWLVSRITTDFGWMQVLNWLISTATAMVVVVWWPLRRLEQAALLAGMLFLLGYSTITEDYMLGTLALALVVAGFSARWPARRMLVLIALLGSVNFLFSLLAIGLMVGVVVSWARPSERHLVPLSHDDTPRRTAAYVAAGSAAIVLAVAVAYPAGDNVWRRRGSLSAGTVLDRIGHHVTESILPWVDTVRLQDDRPIAFVALLVVVLAVCIGAVALAWTAGAGHGVAATLLVGLLAVNSGVGYDDVRWWHRGVITLAVTTALVIGRLPRFPRPRSQAVGTVLLGFVLAGQMVSSFSEPGRGMWGDRPYSNASAAAAVVEQACTNRCTVVVDIDFRSSAVSAHLGGRALYAVNAGAFTTYTRWGDRTWYRPSWDEVLTAAALFERPVLVLSGLRGSPDGWTLVASFDDAIWSDENFAVYVEDDG